MKSYLPENRNVYQMCKWYWGWPVYPGTIFSVYLLSPVDSGSLFLVVDLVVGTSDKMEAGSKWIVSYKNK